MRQHCHTSVYITNEEMGPVVLHKLFIAITIIGTIQSNELAQNIFYIIYQIDEG